MAKIQGVNVLLELSADGVTYKSVICESGHTINRERATNTVETKCYGGTSSVSIGALSGSVDYTGIFDTAPSGTQLSGNEIFAYQEAGTYLYWRATTTGYTRKGQGYITSISEDAPVDNLLAIEFTIQIDGSVTTV